MKLFSPFPISFVLLIFCNKFAHSAQDCLQHTSEVCKSTNVWTDGAFCNAIYGNYPGNKQNLQKLMFDHFKQSFQFIVTVTYTQIFYIFLANKISYFDFKILLFRRILFTYKHILLDPIAFYFLKSLQLCIYPFFVTKYQINLKLLFLPLIYRVVQTNCKN